MDDHLAGVKKQFEKENPGKKVELVPIKAPDSEYYTKLQQMLRSPKTARTWSTRTRSSSTRTSPAGT
ncbi:hypothetical protein SALBM311S_09333 [Streptomyces alboniger]